MANSDLKVWIYLLSQILLISLMTQSEATCQTTDYMLIKSEYMVFEPQNVIELGEGCYHCGAEHFLVGISVDSSIVGENAILYLPNLEIFTDEPYCLKVGPSIIGDSLIEQSDGISTSLNKNGDEIVVDRNLNLGESNVFYIFEDGKYVTATVTSHEPESILDISDSVKTFDLQLYDSFDTPIDDPINTMSLKISKSFGLIHFFNFRNFPDLNYGFTSLDLISSDSLLPEDLFITYGDIYDFNIGDEFHYRNTNYSYGPDGNENVVRRIVGKLGNLTMDTIQYTFEELRWGKKINPQPPISYAEFRYDTTYTVTYTNLNDRVLMPDVMPFEAIPRGGLTYANYLMYKNLNSYNDRYILRKYGYDLNFETDCAQLPLDSYSGSFTYYIVGCGHLYSRIIAEIEVECYPCEHLSYFKKGEEEWGVPLGLPDYIKNTSGVKIYPNPAKNHAMIQSLEEISQIRIYDSVGKIMPFEISSFSNTVELDVSHFQIGIYIVLTESQTGIIALNKLLIE